MFPNSFSHHCVCCLIFTLYWIVFNYFFNSVIFLVKRLEHSSCVGCIALIKIPLHLEPLNLFIMSNSKLSFNIYSSLREVWYVASTTIFFGKSSKITSIVNSLFSLKILISLLSYLIVPFPSLKKDLKLLILLICLYHFYLQKLLNY